MDRPAAEAAPWHTIHRRSRWIACSSTGRVPPSRRCLASATPNAQASCAWPCVGKLPAAGRLRRRRCFVHRGGDPEGRAASLRHIQAQSCTKAAFVGGDADGRPPVRWGNGHRPNKCSCATHSQQDASGAWLTWRASRLLDYGPARCAKPSPAHGLACRRICWSRWMAPRSPKGRVDWAPHSRRSGHGGHHAPSGAAGTCIVPTRRFRSRPRTTRRRSVGHAQGLMSWNDCAPGPPRHRRRSGGRRLEHGGDPYST